MGSKRSQKAEQASMFSLGWRVNTTPEVRYGEVEAKGYQKSRHGPDGAKFLDPHISQFMATVPYGSDFLDVGAGAASVSIDAARIGRAYVFAVDNSEFMIEQARKAVQMAGLSYQVRPVLADAKDLSQFPDDAFPRVTSINVACNLENDLVTPHFREMQRVLSPRNGQLLFTVPIHLGEIFTTGNLNWDQVKDAIEKFNQEVPRDQVLKPAISQKYLGHIDDIHRATFAQRGDKLYLVADNLGMIPQSVRDQTITMDQLDEGELVLRKLPGLLVLNNARSLNSYESAMRRIGLKIEEKHLESFESSGERQNYNNEVTYQVEKQLGREYIGKGPFAVYILERCTKGE